jgi:amidophosphoribosyltransferase
MGELKHECGVAAVYHAAGDTVSSLAPISGDMNSVTRLIPRMLLDMQNRGQLAAGMSSYHPTRKALLRTHKELGTVAEAFRLNHRAKFESIMRGQDGPAGIGHVRYATCGGAETASSPTTRSSSTSFSSRATTISSATPTPRS